MIKINGAEYDYVDMTVEELVAEHGIEPRGVAVAIDGEIVRRSQWVSTRVVDGSTVEIVTAAAGG
jgi:sulfur carrier protein